MEKKKVKRRKQLNLGSSQDLANGLDEVVSHLESKTNDSFNVTRADALRYLLKIWREHKV